MVLWKNKNKNEKCFCMYANNNHGHPSCSSTNSIKSTKCISKILQKSRISEENQTTSAYSQTLCPKLALFELRTLTFLHQSQTFTNDYVTHVWSQLHWTLIILFSFFILPSLSVNNSQSTLLYSTQLFHTHIHTPTHRHTFGFHLTDLLLKQNPLRGWCPPDVAPTVSKPGGQITTTDAINNSLNYSCLLLSPGLILIIKGCVVMTPGFGLESQSGSPSKGWTIKIPTFH